MEREAEDVQGRLDQLVRQLRERAIQLETEITTTPRGPEGSSAWEDSVLDQLVEIDAHTRRMSKLVRRHQQLMEKVVKLLPHDG